MEALVADDAESHLEGIGDEVVTGFVFTTIFAAMIMYHLWRTTDVTWLRNWWRTITTPTSSTDGQQPSPGSPTRAAQANRLRVLAEDERCLICLEALQLPVESNCGHLFCAECLLKWLEGVGSRASTTSCPACRQHVSVLLKGFSQSQVEGNEHHMQLLRRINLYNRRYSGEPRPWIEHVRDLPLLLRHVVSEFFSLGGLMYMFRLRIFLCFVAALVYLISPLDMIPEAVFGLLGFLDDLFVLVLLGVYMTLIYRRFLAERWADD